MVGVGPVRGPRRLAPPSSGDSGPPCAVAGSAECDSGASAIDSKGGTARQLRLSSPVMTESIPYWHTCTIAEAQSEGYTHLRAHCPRCGWTTDIPWRLVGAAARPSAHG